MKRSLQALLRTVGATLFMLPATIGFAQQTDTPGYQPPTFFGAAQGGQMGNQFPASPLAGGPAAAQGDSFMDAHGRPIVMQTNYCQGYPGGEPCAMCPGGGCPGGYGDPMAVDFGGYGQDQVGPHYFDVAIESVFLKVDDTFGNIGPFSSIGAGLAAPRALDPSGLVEEDFEAGWRIAGRYDIGALAVLEVAYMGLYDFGFSQQVRSVDVAPGNADNQLFSVFSNFGLGTLTGAFDQASVHRISYESDLQSTEISFRRYWVGNNPRVSGTMLAGARYVRMTEDFEFFGQSNFNAEQGSLNLGSENELVGFQIGGDAWLGLRQGLRVGCEGKTGIYNNRFKFNASGTGDVAGANLTLPPEQEGNQIAFVAEAGASFVADLMPSWSVKGGYQVFYMNSIVAVGDNIATNIFAQPAPPVPALATQGHSVYHGFHGGLEYVW